jgi:hypothetical protein
MWDLIMVNFGAMSIAPAKKRQLTRPQDKGKICLIFGFLGNLAKRE